MEAKRIFSSGLNESIEINQNFTDLLKMIKGFDYNCKGGPSFGVVDNKSVNSSFYEKLIWEIKETYALQFHPDVNITTSEIKRAQKIVSKQEMCILN